MKLFLKHNHLNRFYKVMRLSFVFIFFVLVQVAATSYSQSINLDVRNMEIRQVIKNIEQQSDYRFFFTDGLTDLSRKVDIKLIDQPIDEVLLALLENTQLGYQLVDNKLIMLAPKGILQQITITGTVTDSEGEPLPGVTIQVKGTQQGTATDANGAYFLQVPDENSILTFSFIGFISQEITVGDKKNINVILTDDTQQLEEVIVVGYGTQKKVHLTGAVSNVKVDEALSGRSITNAAIGLQGILPGLSVSQSSGMAGNNDVSMLIRGLGTVNNANPLILIDGMPDVDINRLNMNDIESISVLKDAASSAVYGSRAANGVILITTRSGKEQSMNKSRVSISSSLAIGMPAKDVYPLMNDYARVLTMHQTMQAVNTFPESYNYKNGTVDQWMAMGWIDPFLYPNTDWWDIIMRNSTVWKNNATVSGNTDRFSFYFSLGMMDEKGLQLNNDYKLYNSRLNAEYKIRHNMNIGVRVSGNWSKWQYGAYDTGFMPLSGSNLATMLAPSGITPYDPFTDLYGGAMAYNENQNATNILGEYTLQLNHQNRQEILPSMYFDWEPVKGLTARFDYALNYNNQFRWNAYLPFTQYDFQHQRSTGTVRVATNAPVQNWHNSGYKTQMSGRLNYQTVIKDHHNINIMGVYSEEYWYTRSLSGYRYDRIHPSIHEINAALTNNVSISGTSNSEGLRSFVGKANYIAYDKYLLEASFRFDASSKFIGSKQWGFFPSFSLGWRFMEERFLDPLKTVISNGKLRLSYGSLGNNSGVGRYEQKETLTQANYIINQSVSKGFVNKKLINPDLSWEITAVTNMGIELGFLNNRLNVELDYYDRLTTGMNRPSDLSIFLSGHYNAPRKNIGNLRNRGIETNITWNDRLGDWNYKLNFNFAYNRNRLEKWNELLNRGTVFIDMPYRFVYGYEDTGIAQTWADIYNATPQGASPGDILLYDLNGDGLIDGNDLRAYPKYNMNIPSTTFGFNFYVSWKKIDCSGLLSGAMGRRNYLLSIFHDTSFSTGRNLTWDQYNNWWSWENRDGGWPRVGANGNSRARSTSWLENMNYLRLKNIQLGYTLTGRATSKIGIESFRIFGSAENLFTLTKYRGTDPEKQNDGNETYDLGTDVYPLVKSFSIGININI